MRAAVFERVGSPLVLQERPDPKPGNGDVIIRVARCGICSSDLHMTSGHAFTYPAGTVLGHEYAGEVVEVGGGVRRLKLGDRVTALPLSSCGVCEHCLADYPIACTRMQSRMSGYAQFAVVAEDSAVRLPASLSLSDGALVEPIASAHRGMSLLPPAIERLAVFGAGPIGLSALFWARQRGVKSIACVARSERHRDLALSMGASAFFSQQAGWQERLSAALGGSPQAVIECVGAVGSLSVAMDLVATRGVVVSLGMCMQPDALTPFMAGFKGVTLHFSAAYGIKDFEQSVRALDEGAVEPRHMITRTIALNELPATFEAMRSSMVGCKTLVAPWSDVERRAP